MQREHQISTSSTTPAAAGRHGIGAPAVMAFPQGDAVLQRIVISGDEVDLQQLTDDQLIDIHQHEGHALPVYRAVRDELLTRDYTNLQFSLIARRHEAGIDDLTEWIDAHHHAVADEDAAEADIPALDREDSMIVHDGDPNEDELLDLMDEVFADPRFIALFNHFNVGRMTRIGRALQKSSTWVKFLPVIGIIKNMHERNKAGNAKTRAKFLMQQHNAANLLMQIIAYGMNEHYGGKKRNRGISAGIGAVATPVSIFAPGAGEALATGSEAAASALSSATNTAASKVTDLASRRAARSAHQWRTGRNMAALMDINTIRALLLYLGGASVEDDIVDEIAGDQVDDPYDHYSASAAAGSESEDDLDDADYDATIEHFMVEDSATIAELPHTQQQELRELPTLAQESARLRLKQLLGSDEDEDLYTAMSTAEEEEAYALLAESEAKSDGADDAADYQTLHDNPVFRHIPPLRLLWMMEGFMRRGKYKGKAAKKRPGKD